MASHREIAEAFAGTGLELRGGFHAAEGESLPEALAGRPAASVVLIGNVGGSVWPAFSAARVEGPNPLDGWTRDVTAPIADRLGARAVYPSEPPWQPFQRWAMRAEPVSPSPIGILIHPEHGLWHAYRAALLFADRVADLPERAETQSPCLACVEKPCLSGCPVEAFRLGTLDLERCSGHLRGNQAPRCRELGCRARDACPVGREHRYPGAQIRFHMRAFARARGIIE